MAEWLAGILLEGMAYGAVVTGLAKAVELLLWPRDKNGRRL